MNIPVYFFSIPKFRIKKFRIQKIRRYSTQFIITPVSFSIVKLGKMEVVEGKIVLNTYIKTITILDVYKKAIRFISRKKNI